HLIEQTSYLGALEVTAANPAHWVVYDQSLIRMFRIVGDELRMFYAKADYEGGADRDEGMFEHWRKSGIFRSVECEDKGLRGTIFDEYDTLERARRRAELEDYLSGQLAAVVNEILIRLPDLDPNLPEALHAALRSFSSYESNE